MDKNNLFSFATSELSQDAFICWCANWANFKDDEKGLYDMGVEFVKLVTNCKDTHIDKVDSVEIFRQYNKIDVLLIVNKTICVIIEDKTFTGEHDDQIKEYCKKLENDIKADKLRGYIEDKEHFTITTTFFKTGEYYPDDKETAKHTENSVNREQMINLIKKYIAKSDIVNDYYERLIYLDNWYSKYKEYNANGNFNASFRENWGQYCYMDDVFRDKKMLGKFSDRDVIIECSTSHGRPFTWVWLWGKENWYWLGYRIDCDDKGYFISLRQYRYYKKSEEKDAILAEKTEMFNQMKATLNIIIKPLGLEADIGGNNASYNESEIVKFYFIKNNAVKLKDNLYYIADKLVQDIEKSGFFLN